MKGIRKFKKFLVVCFILSLLSNYFLILGEFCNAVYASTPKTSIFGDNAKNESKDETEIKIHGKGENSVNSVNTENEEEKKESIFNDIFDLDKKENEVSNQKIENTSNNETKLENIVEDNEIDSQNPEIDENDKEIPKENDDDKNNENTSILDDLTYSEEPEEENSVKNDMVLEENDKNLEENKTIENQLSVDSYQIDGIEIYSDLRLNKFIKFDNESGKGVFVETILKIEYNKENKKIDNMYISLDVPKINELMPIHVNISNATTWMYDTENEKLNIEVENVEKFSNDVCLEYKLQFVYTEEAYSAEDLIINGVVGIGNIEKQIEREIACSITEIIETTESYVNYKAGAENPSIYKGYLKANIISNTKNETTYDVVKGIEIKDCNFVDIIELEDIGDKLIQEDGQELGFEAGYKKTLVNKENFEKMLGEEGLIEIYTKDREFIGTISQLSVVENGNYVFEYEKHINEIIFRIVNPVRNGKIEIKNQKSIEDTNVFTNEQVESFKYIKSNIKGKLVKQIYDQEFVLQSVELNNQISLENTESKMKIELENKELSTELENEVTINVTLETDEEKYELFKNPTIDIEFPYSVEEIEIKNINLLYKNGLSLDTWNVVTNTAGEKIIRVVLSGTQLEYAPGTLIDGTQLVIYANVKVNRLTANGISNIKLKYTNEASSRMSYTVAGKEAEAYEVNYVSKSGLIKATKFMNFNENFDMITNYDNEFNMGSLDIYEEKRTAKMSMAILNNYSTEISDVIIIGRIPVVGNKDKDGKDLNTTIDTYLNREISISGIISKVYYSNDINIQKDDDGWQEVVEDISKVKSYKIVIENEKMKKGEIINFDYDLVIPENLKYNEEIYGIFSVYYNLNGEMIVEDSIIGAKTEDKELVLEDCQTTEIVPEIALGIGTQVILSGRVIEENEEVREGQILRYTILLSNNGTEKITNIKVKGTVENGNIYYKNTYEILSSTTGEMATTYDWIEDTEGKHFEENFDIESLKPGESKEISYQIVTKNSGEETFGKIEVLADNIESKTIETIKNKIVESDLKIFVTTGTKEDIRIEDISSNGTFRIKTQLENISNRILENLVVDVEIPKFMILDELMTSLSYELEPEVTEKVISNIITFYVDKLEVSEKKDLEFIVTVGQIDLEKEKEKIILKASTQIGEEKYVSNDYIRYVEQTQSKFTAKYTANRENGSTVKHNDNIVYNLSITNTGAIEEGILVEDVIPYGFKVESSKITYADGTIQDIEINNNYLSETIIIKPKETAIVEISGVVDVYNCRSAQKDITNIFELRGTLEDTEIKEYSYTIEFPEDYINEDNLNISNGDSDQPLLEDDLPKEEEDTEEPDNNEEIPEGGSDSKDNIPEQPEDGNNSEDNTPEDNDQNVPEDNKTEENKNQNITDKEPEKIEKPEDSKEDTIINQNVIIETKKYSISGYAWYDSDKDGLYNNEEKAQNVTVYLFKSNNQNIKEKDLVKTTKTNDKGEYKFTDLEKANYIVVFSYDNTLYKATKYLASNGLSINKSYVHENTVKINGEEKKYGLSDVINLTGNISNINAGLVSLNEFDMSIKTYLSSATIQNSKENVTKEFEKNSKINKIEIAAKYIDETKITAKYKIEITNNGNISGYVNQIEYIIQEGFEFSKELNKNWTLGTDGKIYNSSISGVEIKAGESKSFNLILTKDMTSNTTGTFTNEVKILNATNSLQIEDENSENDVSKTNLLITIKTGAVIYISTIIIVLIVLAIIAYFICKKTNKNFFRKKKIITILVLCVISLASVAVYAAESVRNYMNSDLETFYEDDLSVGVRVTGGSSQDEYDECSTYMCIEGTNIAPYNWGNKRRAVVWVDFNKRYDNYKNYYRNQDTIGTNKYVPYFSFIGFAAEKYIYGTENIYYCYKNTLTDVLDHDSYQEQANALKTILNLSSIKGDGNQYINSNILNDAEGIMNWYTSNDNTDKSLKVISKTPTNNIGTVTHNGVMYIGPFTATFATGNYINNSNDESYKNLTQNTNKLLYRTKNSSTNINFANKKIYGQNFEHVGDTDGNGKFTCDISNQNFYIKASDLPEDVEYVRLENSHLEYRGRLVVAASYGDGQIQGIIRGDRKPYTTNHDWKIELGCDVSVIKQIIKVGSTTVVARPNVERSYEIGDEVIFKITVTNKSGRPINMDITDTFNADHYEYVSVPGWDWTKASSTSGTSSYSRNVYVAPEGGTYYIKLRLKENLIRTANDWYPNEVTISNFKNNREDTTTLKNKEGNITTSSDFARCKEYKALISKYIVRITDQNIVGRDTSNESKEANKLYAEPGDVVTFAIKLKNGGQEVLGANLGTIKNISFTDIFTNGDYVENIKYSLNETSGYNSSVPTGWKKSGDTFTYTKTLEPNKTTTLYVQCKVKSAISNIKVTNNVKITSIENKNNIIVYSAPNNINRMEIISGEDKDEFTIKKYTLNVNKDVNAVYDASGNSISNKNEVEIGDTIEYKITVTNDGKDANSDGKIKEIYISDYFNNNLLQCVSFSGVGWTKVTEKTSGNTTTIGFRYTNINGLAPKGKSTLTVKFKVVEIDKNILESNNQITNTIEIKKDNSVKNKNNENIRAFLNGKLKDDTSVTLLKYNLKVNKYISKINGVAINPVVANGKVGLSRSEMDNKTRYDMPVEVEKGDEVTYAITVWNLNQKEQNTKTATIKEITILDTADLGLEFLNKGYKCYFISKDGKYSTKGFSIEEKDGRIKRINYSGELKTGDRIEITDLKAEVTKTNLHLLNLKNNVQVISVKGRNDIDIIEKDLLLNSITNNNEDYVRLKDLTISGIVWEEEIGSGLIDSSEKRLSGITVNLCDEANNKVKTTKTDSNGKYIFEEVEKGTNKDSKTGNYNKDSVLKKYYVEFEYDGTQYMSTLGYASDSRINSDGTYKNDYERDSNATEFKDVRAEFNKKFETISNNKAKGNGAEIDLTYQKEGHESKVKTSPETMMKAQSFINPESRGTDGIGTGDIKYLWLYEDGETEYLKHINLGLQKREIDLSIKQDVYEVKTTINGEQTTYRYNQGIVSGSEYEGNYITGGENSPKTYKFEIYNSDYYFRPSTYYTNEEVIRYKENTELDVEITYKITVTNEKSDRRGTYAVIKELVNYYSDEFIKYGTISGNMKPIKIKTQDGILQDKNKEVISVKADECMPRISDRNQYGQTRAVSGYNNLYITGLESKPIYDGGKLEIYVTYTVGTYKDEAAAEEAIGQLILGAKNSIVEINAYSIYESDGRPAGYIDIDSNPGNMTEGNKIDEYEDDTYRTGIELILNGSLGLERKVKGTVWNDTRSEEMEGQYLGNGKNTIDKPDAEKDKKKSNAESNSKLDETHDIPAEDIKVEMIEQVVIKQADGTVRVYEEQVKPWNNSMMKTRTDRNGKYVVSGFIPGQYVTRFVYGDSETASEIVYNGQNYKSTTFNEGLSTVSKEEVVSKIEEEGLSDARDDEIRRLEVNSYAEVINNEKIVKMNEVTEGILANAEMYAETVPYDVIIEKPGRLLLFDQFSGMLGNENRYSINNVDFGLEYRPEAKFELSKYISNIEVILSNGTKLFDIKYTEKYTDNILTGTELDRANSVGIEKYQFLPRSGNINGFGYLNTDVDLLQGSTIKITYLFSANNLSEVDRISKELYKIRYKGNNEISDEYFEENYTASGTARNKLYKEYYGIDEKGDAYIKKGKEADYYGRYLGEMYYKGRVGTNDVISEVKINKILDYVDTDLTFNSSENNGENNLWSQVKSKELYDGGYVNKEIFEEGYLVDNTGVRFDTGNISNLVISVDDRVSDTSSGNKNISLSKFLKPQSISAAESFGTIKLVTSKVIASENDTNNMTFDNIAEVIEYTSQTGRVANMEATIGNANVSKDVDSEESNTNELDTGRTETISLIPPTGAYTLRYYIAKHMNKILIALSVVAVIGIGIFVKKNIVIKKRYK